MSAGVLFDAPGPKARRRHQILAGIGGLIFLGILALVVMRLNDKHQFTSEMWKPFTTSSMWQDTLLTGLWGTVKAAAISIVIAAVLGGLLALGRMSEIAPLRWVCGVWVELTRAIPVLLMMLFTYGALTQGALADSTLVSADNKALVATVTGLVLYNSAVICEVVRSGVDQLPSGQREAGLSIGLRQQQTLRTILLPQAVTAMLPALVGQLVVILKDTALGYNVLYNELLYSAKLGSVKAGNIVPMMIVVAVIYIIVNYLITKLAALLERRLAQRGRTVAGPDAAQGGGLAGPVGGPSMTHNTQAN
ncbi:amino acid ABC transporter permease [Luteipulveratus mongoliensis]|uniref:amino acid ABC transporter permease n=1 Tax=Luteipulveratus mongoliensis TaxID=571913 RepID=UPI0009F816D3|nr:amino acid ABC transporter permease [Luteipulveratus mongoliensis]